MFLSKLSHVHIRQAIVHQAFGTACFYADQVSSSVTHSTAAAQLVLYLVLQKEERVTLTTLPPRQWEVFDMIYHKRDAPTPAQHQARSACTAWVSMLVSHVTHPWIHRPSLNRDAQLAVPSTELR